MEEKPFPPTNASIFELSLCPTAATLFFLPTTYTLLFLTALPGNALSLWVFLRRIPTASPTHIYLTHLSISNLLLSLTAPFLVAYYARGSAWTRNAVQCQIVLHGITPVLHINIYISLMILTCVALSRFAALIQNTHASRPSTCTMLLPNAFFSRLTRVSFAHSTCIVVWIVSVGAIVPVTVYYSVKEAMGSNSEETQEGGCMEMCYSPAVEIGGSFSATLTVPVITLFFIFYLMVLMSYMTVLRHIKRSRRNNSITNSHSLLSRVLRNIVVIQIVLSVCLLPYHIFKPIFISLAHDEELTHSLSPQICTHCHPLSHLIELKNCLFLLTALRGSTDPVMYFVLDRTFRTQTLKLFRCNKKNDGKRHMFWSITGSNIQKVEHLGETHVATATMDLSH
ncbi:probable G-protein coupled receptor 82 [Mugil cephalus]|uniref:probable G-protein coupled receptor 82 n=1 Tax=Mugil cephalus TaxID=48193 RepID=UPI001FB81F95|nr:probable G-protein coupled receptor 82 [Mugil cephalus]